MKQSFIGLILILSVLFSVSVYAHSLLIAMNENKDGTVTVEGMYSTGGVPKGVEVRLEDNAGRVLWKGEADENGTVTYERPDMPYMVIMDAGRGHVTMQEGL